MEALGEDIYYCFMLKLCVNFASDLQFTLDILPSVVVLDDFNVQIYKLCRVRG